MPILHVELTDTFDTWRQKDNTMIDKVNSLSVAGDVISSTAPSTAQVLIFDGTFYRNATVSGDITIDSSGAVTVTGGGAGTTKGRMRFAGSIKSLF
jgi:hypothetical protein